MNTLELKVLQENASNSARTHSIAQKIFESSELYKTFHDLTLELSAMLDAYFEYADEFDAPGTFYDLPNIEHFIEPDLDDFSELKAYVEMSNSVDVFKEILSVCNKIKNTKEYQTYIQTKKDASELQRKCSRAISKHKKKPKLIYTRNNKNHIVVKCNNCNRLERILKSHLDAEKIKILLSAHTCYCYNCSTTKRPKEPCFDIFTGTYLTVYSKDIIPSENQNKDIKRRNENQFEYQNILIKSKVDINTPNKKLIDFLSFVNKKISKHGCSCNFKFTETFLKDNNIPAKLILEWLQNKNVYCDCDLISNIATVQY